MTLPIPTTPPLSGAALVTAANNAINNLAGQNPTLASGATTDLGSTDSSTITISGATTITSFGSNAALIVGQLKTVVFSGTPIITFNAVSLITPTGSDIQARAGDSLDAIFLGSGNWRIISYSSTGIRQVLTSNRTYFVRSDGSDSNNGLANSSSGAFLTLQKAYNVIASSLDLAGFTVTIQVGTVGTFGAGISITQPWTGGGAVTLDLGGSTINFGNSAVATSCPLPGLFTVQNGTLASTGLHAIAHQGTGIIQVGNSITFGAVAAGNAHMLVNAGAQILITAAAYAVTGAAGFHYLANGPGSQIKNKVPMTVTITGTPAIGTFAYSTRLGLLDIEVTTYSGGTTGSRYNADTNAVIFTSGGGATYFPGTVGGTTSTGGQYL